MLIDLFLACFWFIIAKASCGLETWQAGLVFIACFILDADIIFNEFIRFFIKKEKDKFLSLDEYSYTHKYLCHLPLVILPLAFIAGYFIQGIIFGILLLIGFLGHLVHDTADKNFDGIRWLWPLKTILHKKRTLHRVPFIIKLSI